MRYALAALALLALVQPSAAKVVKFEVVRVESPAFEGRSFGAVGTYDRIIARATIAVSPDDPHNAVIVDLDRAPRNAQGLVEAVSDVEILRPTIAANGNRRLFYDVLNRGNKPALGDFNDNRSGNNLVKAGDAGTGFLMNRGYTLVWSGWQGDVPAGGWPAHILAPSRRRRNRSVARRIHLRPFAESGDGRTHLSGRRPRPGACDAHRARTGGRPARKTG